MKYKKTIASVLTAVMAMLTISGCNLHVIENSKSPDSTSSNGSAVQSSESSKNSTPETTSQSDEITPTVWKVTDENGNYIYMMGSIHAADNSIKNLPGYFETAYSKCDSVAVEIDITEYSSNLNSAVDTIKKLSYTDGTKIYDHIPKETYDKLTAILTEHNLYNKLYDNYKPAMWLSLMENVIIDESGFDIENGLDNIVLKRAHKENKNILEIESMDLQLGLFDEFSDELNALILQQYADDKNIKAQSDAIKELYENWKHGKLNEENVNGENSGEQETSITEKEKEMLEEYNDKTLIQRNINMAEKAEEYMQSDSVVLFIVGSAHFYGDDGILQLMKDKGCTVTILTEKDAENLTSSEQPSNNSAEPSETLSAA